MTIVPHQVPIGTRFFRRVTLTAPRLIPNRKQPYIQCRCDCGTVSEVLARDLTRGASGSCGCYSREVTSRIKTTHGGTCGSSHGVKRKPIYSRWKAMRSRCNTVSHVAYPQYGGRGIKVCQEWDSFEAFQQWAMSHGFQEELELDRIDNNDGYSPGNCRWVTSKQNKNNRKQSRYLTVFGETKTVLDWSTDPRCSVKYHTVLTRLHLGWPEDQAITMTLEEAKAFRKHRLALRSESV